MRLAGRRRRASSLGGSRAISIYNGPLKVRLIMPLAAPHIVRKAGKKFKKSRKFNVLDLYEIDMGGPYAPSVPCTVHKNDFYSLVWL